MEANSTTEGLGAVGVMILAILGLAGVYSDIVASVAAIVVGAIFLLDGNAAGLLRRRFSPPEAARKRSAELGNGVSAGFMAGLAGLILGILSFFQPAPDTLLAVAVLIYGAALLLTGGRAAALFQSQVTPAAMHSMGSGGTFIGLATLVLGILAVTGLLPMTLIMIALLVLGAGAFLTGPAGTTETTQ